MEAQSDDAKEENVKIKEENEALRLRVEELELKLQSQTVSSSSPKEVEVPVVALWSIAGTVPLTLRSARCPSATAKQSACPRPHRIDNNDPPNPL